MKGLSPSGACPQPGVTGIFHSKRGQNPVCVFLPTVNTANLVVKELLQKIHKLLGQTNCPNLTAGSPHVAAGTALPLQPSSSPVQHPE